MLGWLSSCWSGAGSNSSFDRARFRAIRADQQTPEDADINVLMGTFKGHNQEIQPQKAFNLLLANLETAFQKGNPLFLLKHLYIFDQTVQEGVLLELISTYYCSQFFIFKQGSSIEFNPLRQLVATYFLYIKKKAEIYGQFDPKYYLTKKSERQALIAQLSFAEIFTLIDKCLDIQKGINEINIKYKNRNKSAELIQMIFTMLLKTYLFCYSVVSLCSKVLFDRHQNFNKHELLQFYKFIRYYNKDYTRYLYDFIESNKEIYEFKTFKYSQIILIDQSYIQYIQNAILKKDKQPLRTSSHCILDFQAQNQILQLPDTIFQGSIQHLIVNHHHKKIYKVPPVDHQLQLQFIQYESLFSQNFQSEIEVSRRQEYNQMQKKDPNTDLEPPLHSPKHPGSCKRIDWDTSLTSPKFDNNIWNRWENIYSNA